jgi:alkanesulfonate monooxygenase SsuD/methylene tetrahydromethanopterin reductase-like flavin-dependent oxidoreductase (luciferase family)
MIFDLFHSISDPVIAGKSLGPSQVFAQFLRQVKLAETLDVDTVWLAESHFSSEVQKKTSVATIPQFHGEVGLNSDSFQLFHWLMHETKKINLGTGIHNIVGGSGGPIASADRVNMLHFLNQNSETPRTLRMGVASGRFPYQNVPFGVVARNKTEDDFWFFIKRTVFLEALEIFLRLLNGEELESNDIARYQVTAGEAECYFKDKLDAMKRKYAFPLPIPKRWAFEKLKLVPETKSKEGLRIVLGSSDPEALELGCRYWDLDLFNLSFTPPAELERLHAKMRASCDRRKVVWHRSRLPRTVMVFVDPERERALNRAHFVLDNYIEAMRGTAAVPDKKVLLERALVGDAAEVREQLSAQNPRGFHSDDRLMLWFEFNQLDGVDIENQMKYFFNEVVGKL